MHYLYFYVSHFLYTTKLFLALYTAIFVLLVGSHIIAESSVPGLRDILHYVFISFYASGLVSGIQFVGFVTAKALYIYSHANENGITVREIHERGREYMERVWNDEE